MNEEIGAYDARTKLPEILRRVEAGERFTITNRGKPVADLIPSRSADLPNLWHLEAGNVLLVVANGLAVTRFKTVQVGLILLPGPRFAAKKARVWRNMRF